MDAVDIHKRTIKVELVRKAKEIGQKAELAKAKVRRPCVDVCVCGCHTVRVCAVV